MRNDPTIVLLQKGTGPPQKAWSVSKLTSFFQDLSSKDISKILSKNPSCSGRIVERTVSETNRKDTLVK